MADQLQLRGGTTAEHSTFTGALREVTVDTDKDTVVVHDGSTAGGHPLAKQNLSNVPAGTITSTMIADGTIVNADINAAAAIDKTKISGTAITAGDTGTVTSTMIADGTIVNADVNASAAIAGTKISPDFGSQTIQTTGVVSHALGTAAAPTLTFTGDTNTGIYSPGADQVAISTNGTGRLFVDSTGRVGIGTSSISTISERVLHIYAGTGASSGLRLTGNAGTGLDLIHGTDGSGYLYQRDNAFLAIGTNNLERLRITSDGKVGVGTSSPDSPLQVIGNTPAHFRRTSTGFCNVLLSASTAQWSTGVHSDGYYAITHEGVGERLRIDSSGRLGVGTTSPSSTLDINGDCAVANTKAYQVKDSGGTTRYAMYMSGSLSPSAGNDLFIGNTLANSLVLYTNATERLRIDSSGRVGIGTSSPLLPLHVEATTDGPQTLAYLVNASTGGTNETAALAFGLKGTAGTGICRINAGKESDHSSSANTDTFLSFATTLNDTEGERLRITSAGNVGIGTTPDVTLHVATGNATGYVKIDGGTSSSATNGLLFRSGSNTYSAEVSHYQSNLSLYTAGSERARIDSSGRFLVGTSSSLATYLTQINFAGASTNGLYINSSSTSGDGSTMLALARASTPNNTVPVINYVDATAGRFELRNNGGLANYQANNVNLSDINTKKDISPAAGTWDCIKEWEIVNYRYKDQPDDADLNLGVIAQQVAESCPEVITVFQEAKEATEDRPAQEERLGIKEQQMYWMAIKALQEAQVRIEQLEAKVAALESA